MYSYDIRVRCCHSLDPPPVAHLIQQNVLGLCYAQLELDHGYIRAIAPFFSIYDITPSAAGGTQAIMADTSAPAVAIRNYWSSKKPGGGYKVGYSTYHETAANHCKIDAVLTAERSRIERSDIARTISGWELDGDCL